MNFICKWYRHMLFITFTFLFIYFALFLIRYNDKKVVENRSLMCVGFKIGDLIETKVSKYKGYVIGKCYHDTSTCRVRLIGVSSLKTYNYLFSSDTYRTFITNTCLHEFEIQKI